MTAARCICVLLVAVGAWAGEPTTVVESTAYARTATYGEVVEFVHTVARSSEVVTLGTLAESAEGRVVPLVVLSRERVRTPAELRATGKPAVLIMANIHAGEVEGKEACQMLIRDVARGPLQHLLDHQVVLVVPIFNADGNDKFGDNRHDNGPEVAGVRHNGQFLDLNRDYLKLESPEVRGLVRLLASFDPVVVVDMHTTNGSYHREPVTYTTGINPNGAKLLGDYMWGTLFPAVAGRLAAAGYESVPYGNFADREVPEKGWENDSVDVRYGSNYVALRNRLAILDENYSYADFKTRVLSSFEFVKAILEFTNERSTEIMALIRRVDAETRDGFRKTPFVSEWTLERLMDVTIRSYEFEREPVTAEEQARLPWLGNFRYKPTAVERDYRAPYLAHAKPKQSVALPAGYVLLPGFVEALRNLVDHGFAVERLSAPALLAVERFAISSVEPAKSLYQGHVTVTLAGGWEKAEQEIPAGAHFIDMHQPLARLIPVLLEPASADGLATWGFFNRALVRQWSREPGVYPVVRVAARPPVPMEVVTRP